jgi:ATP-dependent phosphofructokinase / diphosphate-dependent phosphofructokinase
VDLVPTRRGQQPERPACSPRTIVNRAGRTGGTFLHTSRTRPSHLPGARCPAPADRYTDEINDVTPEVLKNLEFLGVDC